MQFEPIIDDIHMEGTVSQIFDIGPTFYLMIKKGETFCIFFLPFTIYSMK